MGDKKVLILGATGMLGHTLFTQLSKDNNLDLYATVREARGMNNWFSSDMEKRIIAGVDAKDFSTLTTAIDKIKPDVVINCIGIIKQLPSAKDPITAISINSLLPHRIADTCKMANARFIHISTDCVFDGAKGNYTENDQSNATDLYGRTKFLGEVDYPHCITLRTSIIGHELKGNYGLVEWFLAQEGKVTGYTKAIYTGFPTIELARIIKDYVIPNPELKGLYQVSSEPISKYELLKLVAKTYGKQIEIEPFEDFLLDRSLDSTLFRKTTGYNPPTWTDLVKAMYEDYIKGPYLKFRG
jgi:dTDP-4-dehydrorhamnose reductase